MMVTSESKLRPLGRAAKVWAVRTWPRAWLLTSMSGAWPVTTTSSSMARGRHLDVDGQGLLDAEDDVVPDDGREALETEGDRISPRRKGQETVGAVGIGDRRRRSDEPGPFRFDGDAGEGPSLVVHDGAYDPAGRGSLSGEDPGQEKHGDRRQQRTI